MIDSTLIAPKETTIGGKKFLLSKLPATVGREILLAYVPDGMDGDINYDKVPIEKVLRLLSYASVKIGEEWVRLETREFIDAHVMNILAFSKLEKEMLAHSMDFSLTAKS